MREQDSFEWVNAWAEATDKLAVAALPHAAAVELPAPEPVNAEPAKAEPAIPGTCVIARIAAAMPADQLMRDIAEIERARDALALLPVSATIASGRRVAGSFGRRTQALTLVSPRTSDPVPVVVGGVFALVMLTVFGAAAVMTKLAR